VRIKEICLEPKNCFSNKNLHKFIFGFALKIIKNFHQLKQAIRLVGVLQSAKLPTQKHLGSPFRDLPPPMFLIAI